MCLLDLCDNTKGLFYFSTHLNSDNRAIAYFHQVKSSLENNLQVDQVATLLQVKDD